MTPSIMLISLLFVVLSMAVSYALRSKIKKYSETPMRSGLSGKEVAERMLRESGIFDVRVVPADGFLSDHYNPITKTVSLSTEIYEGRNVAAAAIAAHECGHALQHATGYPWLTMRSKLVPAVQFSSNIVQWVLLAGIFLINVFPGLLLGGIVLFAVTTLFSLITLPVEFDASNRALAWLDQTRITTVDEQPKAKDALKWAAMTYVVAAVASIATLIQYIFIYMGRRD
ncbi:zinc metallopeptidase [Flavihumibacter fluvii]|uniref:zinc metallopeptidase n=1 Tax=Flavihumibacter fluvii TaxID=2838157 RepID=UPI001BDEA98B|nr:zinc metallopeptidase [Flavihumibacter fluvii]ULQ51258.1 zinc metallopeptidase [Flavihumibacter fluvii]